MEPVRTASPTLLTPVYGRTHEVQAVTQMLRSGTRLVTLRGPGGIGKTALARHIAHEMQHAGGQVVFVELAAVREAHQVLDTIAATLPAADRPGTALHTIARAVSDRPTLLILDNFEQVVDAAGDLLKVLAAADTVQMLVTSRTVLGLHDEHEYPLEPLSLPASLEHLGDSGAVEMFLQRVQGVRPEFRITPENAREVAALVHALEGVPLAIELAAARLRSYTLTDLLEHLDHPLTFLKADFRDRPERLRSLRAAVQWSYDLLVEPDRDVFECCAVFEGAFSPQALAAVWSSAEVIDRAESLLSQSFLHRLDTPDTLWKMLQPLRELALEHLEGHPQAAVWRERHAHYFLNLVEAYQHSWALGGLDSSEAYLPHYPNIRAGMVWAVVHRSSDLAYRFLGAAGELWVHFGLMVQEAPLVEQVLALPAPESSVARLKALEISARSLEFTGQFHAREARLNEIMALCRELGDVEGEASTSLQLAAMMRDAGQQERAWEITQRIIRELRERVGDTPPTRQQQLLQANVHQAACRHLLELGQYAQALESAQLACQHFLKVDGQTGYGSARTMVGHLLVRLQRLPEAQTVLLACLHDAVEKGLRGRIHHVLRWGLIFAAAELRQWAILVQFTAFVNDPVGEPSQSATDRLMQQNLVRARDELRDTAYQRAWTTGAQLQLQDVVELAERLTQMPISPTTHPELTPREREVLALVAQGHPDRRVARLLDISPSTASRHVGNLLSKLGLHNRVELARWAIEHLSPGGAEPAAAQESPRD
ncbi:ATP-binding protein [Deinococcus navajonensis]|uniref:ATP-binding protein n=1 Tax=Deinococcus navajonensis TaxID=309884 RepID=A0ABV8XJL9_9DEIO